MKMFPCLALLLSSAACSNVPANDAAADPVALVSLAGVEQGALVRQVVLHGAVESGASGRIVLAAPVEATVARIIAPVGTQVHAGDVVAQLTATPVTRSDLAKASADARAADAAYARAMRLRGDGLVADSDVETARAAAASADAVRASLATRAGALVLRAPVAGFVESVAVNMGDIVQGGTAVAAIARAGDLRARFGVDPATARSLRVGSPIEIASGAGRPALAVRIESIALAIDPQTRLASVYTRLPAAAGFGIGEILDGAVAMGSSDVAATAPYAALLDDGGQPFVFVVARGVAHRRDVLVGPADGHRVAILKGVRAGERVVIQGGTAIEDGMKVRTR